MNKNILKSLVVLSLGATFVGLNSQKVSANNQKLTSHIDKIDNSYKLIKTGKKQKDGFYKSEINYTTNYILNFKKGTKKYNFSGNLKDNLVIETSTNKNVLKEYKGQLDFTVNHKIYRNVKDLKVMLNKEYN